mmetsp:Transcript_84003/g.270622  ORF Transcript_84003/g.270622 Transcript_84003/m.270622 type:complete len:329 (-) Transcript_84003:246-1232(-)
MPALGESPVDGVRRVSFALEGVDESDGRPRPVVPFGQPPALTDAESLPDALMSLTKVRPMQFPPIPACFVCPISRQLMLDPVTAADGASYERGSIASLLSGSRLAASPLTGQLLTSAKLSPNVALKAAIEAYQELRDAVEIQWMEVEASMSQYTRQSNHKIEHDERKVKDLRRQIQTFDEDGAMHSARRSHISSIPLSSMSTIASLTGHLADSPEEPNRGPTAAEEARDAGAVSACPFSVGPAPRPHADRGERRGPVQPGQGPRPSPRSDWSFAAGHAPRGQPRQHLLPRKLQQQQEDEQAKQQKAHWSLFGAMTSPRLTSFMRSPRS